MMTDEGLGDYYETMQPYVEFLQQRGTKNNGYQPDTTQSHQGPAKPLRNQQAPPYPPQQAPHDPPQQAPPYHPQQAAYHQKQQIRVSDPQNQTQAPMVQSIPLPLPTVGLSSDASSSSGIKMSEQTVTKIIKAVCFLVTMICASVVHKDINDLVDMVDPSGTIYEIKTDEHLKEVAYGIGASVIGLIIEVVTLVLLSLNVFTNMTSKASTTLLMILNIVNLLFFFTSVITMKFSILALLELYLDEFTVFSAFSMIGIMAGSIELHVHVGKLRRNKE